MWVNCRSGYTFKKCYAHLDDIVKKCKKLCIDAGIEQPYCGIADEGNTFSHVPFAKVCKENGVKAIFGVRLPVCEDLFTKERRYPFNIMTFIARNTVGLQEIYRLVDLSFQQFYYRQRISYDQLNKVSTNVHVLSGVAPRFDLIKKGILKELSPATPKSKREHAPAVPIACIDNYYVDAKDEIIYEPFTDKRLLERKTSPIHILSKQEWMLEYPKPKDKNAFDNLIYTAKMCNAELPHAGMVKYKGSDNIQTWCMQGAKKKGIDYKKGKYHERYKREIKLILKKDYADYFLVVADLIRYAKKHMTVGGGRGSSAGSLVCYLMGITEVDPIKNGLFFERFIDINRHDLPDIDIDFQDDKRHLILKYLQKKYGKDSVAQVCNINRFKPKSAINKFAQALSVPIEDAIELKDSVIERKPGDERANKCLADTFTETEVGKEFIEKYPRMRVVQAIENHPSHMGVHAAGLLVSNESITNFCGVNSRDKKRIGMLDKKDAETVGLLKIDALGLTTLTIIASVCDQIGKPYEWIHTIPLDDDFVFDIFNENRYTGIFQFEGGAIQKLAKAMQVENIEDISALCALCRPGPLQSGGAWDFIHAKNGDEVEHASHHEDFINATKNTYGVLVYQEQMLDICRNYGLLSWEDTSELRKITSKTKGKESFDKYREKFIEGAIKNGDDEESALSVWHLMITFGKYAFNKSHSVSYAVISYLCAYFKYHHPVEFTLACLKHTDSDRTALKILRDAVEHDGVEYEYFDEGLSQVDWSIQSGVLYGGFKSLPGLGVKKSQQAVKLRDAMDTYPAGMGRIIKKADSPFKYLYPADELYGDYYSEPEKFGLKGGVSQIKDVIHDGEYTIIGCMISKKLRDANEQDFISKRNGKYLEGDTTWLNIVVEDDTGSIMCKIKKEYYRKLGKAIAETGKEDKDWYLIYGNKINGWGLLFVENIKKITR